MTIDEPRPHVFQNAVLQRLDSHSVERLRLRPFAMKAGQRIAAPDDPVHSFFFLESGSVSLRVSLADGSLVETSMVGTESIVCGSAVLGFRQLNCGILARTPANGYACCVSDGLQEFARFGKFHDLALKCLHAELLQTSQIAACNVRHEVLQRLCRWLLQRQDSDAQQIVITHEELGIALGVRRTTITKTMEALRLRRLLIYSRGHIQVLDRSGIELLACECYKILHGAALRELPSA